MRRLQGRRPTFVLAMFALIATSYDLLRGR